MDKKILLKASKTYLENFLPTTCFERAVFFSWYCKTGDCTFCYMSTQPREAIEKRKFARRSVESILAEFILCKKLGWDIGFFSGGHGAFDDAEFDGMLKLIHEATKEKVWVNIGALSREELERFKPYIKGVVGSVETINREIHDKVFPSKPLEPRENMFDEAKKLGIQRAITIILGLGETIDDIGSLHKFIRKHEIAKLHIYGLNPHPGTVFENSKPPSPEYQAEWIARIRIEFPKIDIQCGIWLDRVERVQLLLEAGANSVSKFPAIRKFGGKEAHDLIKACRKAGREFKGNLTKIPEISEIDLSGLDEEVRVEVKKKIDSYIMSMKRSIQKRS